MTQKQLPTLCTSCKGLLKVRNLACDSCETSIMGTFELPILARLSEEDQFSERLKMNPTALLQFSPDMILFIYATIFIVLMAVWMVALMYRVFSVSCNEVGKTAVSVFIISLLVGEILSLVALHHGSQVCSLITVS